MDQRDHPGHRRRLRPCLNNQPRRCRSATSSEDEQHHENGEIDERPATTTAPPSEVDATRQPTHASHPRPAVLDAAEQAADAALPHRTTKRTVLSTTGQLRQRRGLALTPGGGNWKLNLEPGRPERIRLGGRDVTARPDLIDDVDEIDNALMTMTAVNPRTASFIPIARRDDGHFDRDGLTNAVAHGFRIVRWHLDASVE